MPDNYIPSSPGGLNPADLFDPRQCNSTYINYLIRRMIDMKGPMAAAGVTDGTFSFSEHYYHQSLMFAALLNCPLLKKRVWKSWKTWNGEAVRDGMFLAGIDEGDKAIVHLFYGGFWDELKIPTRVTAPDFFTSDFAMADNLKWLSFLWGEEKASSKKESTFTSYEIPWSEVERLAKDMQEEKA
jgi:hypothetical protein